MIAASKTPVTVFSASSADRRATRGGGFWHTLSTHRYLISQLARKEVVGRYRGSHLGIFWSFLNPISLLLIYTFVFKFIFKAKLTGHPHSGPFDFALTLFAALIVFNMFAECLGRAPSLILLNVNYVTKVVFPLEVLPLAAVLGSMVHLLISFVPLCMAVQLLHPGLSAAALLWPLLLVPILFWSLGVTWLVSAMGVFLRDLNEVMLSLTQILMYGSAVFYTLEQIAPEFRRYLIWNPLVFFSEQSKNLVVWGEPMNWPYYGWVTLSGAVFMTLGFQVFVRVKHAFADVV
jgi:lipopolysaccharide transport system permease protein